MKRLFAYILAFIFILFLPACSGGHIDTPSSSEPVSVEDEAEEIRYRSESYAGLTFKIATSWRTEVLDEGGYKYYPTLSEPSGFIRCGWIEAPTPIGNITDDAARTLLDAMIANTQEGAPHIEEIRREYFKMGTQNAVRMSFSYDLSNNVINGDKRGVLDMTFVLYDAGIFVLTANFTESEYQQTYHQMIETAFESLEEGEDFQGITPPAQSEQATEASIPSSSMPPSSSVPPSSTAPSQQASASNSEGDIGDYHVKILDAALGKDYGGKPMIVVNFEFTNNSEEATAFMFAVNVKAFQDGVELDSLVMVLDTSVYDAGLLLKELKTGARLVVQDAFLLSSDSPIDIEVTELFSFDGNAPVLTKTFTLGTNPVPSSGQTESAPGPEASNSSAASPATSSSTQAAGTSVAWREFLKEYEDWVDAYVALVDKYKSNPSDISILTEYTAMLQELAEWSERADELEGDLASSPSELAEYLQTISRILQKLNGAI